MSKRPLRRHLVLVRPGTDHITEISDPRVGRLKTMATGLALFAVLGIFALTIRTEQLLTPAICLVAAIPMIAVPILQFCIQQNTGTQTRDYVAFVPMALWQITALYLSYRSIWL